MASDDLALLYCRFIDGVVNHRQLDHLDQFLAGEVVEHAPSRTIGLATAQQTLADWLAAFPDLHLVIEDLVVEGDHLMARLTATGTHRGPLSGLVPTSRRVRLTVYEAWSAPDGPCLERWLHLDRWELRRQLRLPLDRAVRRERPPAAG